MSESVYAAYVFDQQELKYNGPLSHQFIHLSMHLERLRKPFMKVENMNMKTLAAAIDDQLENDCNAYKLLADSVESKDSALLYTIPAVELNGTERGQLKFVSAHRGGRRVLMRAMKVLGCKYTQLLPDPDVEDEDPAITWTVTSCFVNDGYREIKVLMGARRLSRRAAANKRIALRHVKNVRLSEILYVMEHTDAAGLVVRRLNDPPLFMNSKRSCEKFKFPPTDKSNEDVLRSIDRELGGSPFTMSELWSMVVDCAKLFV